MSELVANRLKSFIHSQLGAERLSDILIGTVTNDTDIEITIDTTQLPLRSAHLLIPQQFSIFKAKIIDGELISDSTIPDEYRSRGTLTQEKIEGFVKVDNRLKVGDKVVLLSFQQEQKFLVIDRVYDASTE